jgi:enoyl-CoA hydratase
MPVDLSVEDAIATVAINDRALREVIGKGQGLTRRIENFPKPFIVAVNGMALGGGCEAEAAHLAVAADHAVFGKPEITLGFGPPFDAIDARRAYDIGLVNSVVPADDLRVRATQLAERIIRHAPTAVAACLAAVTRGINLPIDEKLAVEASWFASTVPSERVRDGLDRFLNRSERSGTSQSKPERRAQSSAPEAVMS